MKRLSLFAWLLLALPLSTPAYAGPVGDLCGQTLTENKRIRDAVETLTDDCEIRLATGVKLRISSSDINSTATFFNIGPVSSAEGTQVEILSSNLSTSGEAVFLRADRVTIRGSTLDNLISIRGNDVVIRGSDFNGYSGLGVGAINSLTIAGSDLLLPDGIRIGVCKNFATCIMPATASTSIRNSILGGDDFEFRTSGDLVMTNSSVFATGLGELSIAVENNARISGNEFSAQDAPTEINTRNLVFKNNEFSTDFVRFSITADEDARVMGNLFESGDYDINAVDLLVLMRNDFFQSTVSFSGSSCRIKNNTFGPGVIVNDNCP